jgi:hypothetical protein
MKAHREVHNSAASSCCYAACCGFSRIGLWATSRATAWSRYSPARTRGAALLRAPRFLQHAQARVSLPVADARPSPCGIPIPYGSRTGGNARSFRQSACIKLRRDRHSEAQSAPESWRSPEISYASNRAESRCEGLSLPQAQPLQGQQGDFVRRKRTKSDETCVAFRPVWHHRLGLGRCTRCAGMRT